MSKKTFDVGYGKPPKESRFVKGQSGNPNGRPKGKKNLATLIEDAIYEPIKISVNGKKQNTTKIEVIMKQLVNKAATGDNPSTKILFSLLPFINQLKDEDMSPAAIQEADAAILELLQIRLHQMPPKQSTTEGGSDE